MIHYQFEPKDQRSAAYDEERCIGECDFEVENGQWYITHTEVLPSYGGQGIARHLVLTVQEHAQKQGVSLVPICSYAVKVLSSPR